MKASNALRTARDFITSEGGTISPLPITEEELNPGPQDDLSVRVTNLEPTTNCYAVPYDTNADSAASEFAFFEDGKQRTVHIGYIPVTMGRNTALVPVHFFVVAAVILERRDRQLTLWDRAEVQCGILVERSLVPDQSALERYEEAGLTVADTHIQGGDYYALRQGALEEAKSIRLAAEDRLITRWRARDAAALEFLIVDGTLMNFRNEKNVERCIGVSKSFSSRYFDVTTQNRILVMDEFQRSWTFRFHSPEEESDDSRLGARDRISWYLRLRSNSNSDPEFGLIRVEMSTHHANDAPALAERFSRSLISERHPASYPAPRWDNHLYPIAACESYLSSIMPSITTIVSSMKG